MKKALVLDTCLLVLLVVGATNRKYIVKHKNCILFITNGISTP